PAWCSPSASCAGRRPCWRPRSRWRPCARPISGPARWTRRCTRNSGRCSPVRCADRIARGGAIAPLALHQDEAIEEQRMIGSSLALLATVVEALPPDAAAAATEAAVTAAHGGINYLDLMLRASLPVKLIVLLLLAGSLISWVIIFRKLGAFKRADQEADEFENRFWSGADLGKLYAAATDRNRVVVGLEAIFEAGFREFA